MSRILLVEPSYRNKNKFPPLGLMKISTYHKLKGDFVRFTKGCDPSLRKENWDRIYVSTLFTFYWKETVKTIKYYEASVPSLENLFVGGVMATLLTSELQKATDARIITGLINKPGILDRGDRCIVDNLTPDYKILDEIDHEYGLKDAYIGYATRGCLNKCGFCAVNRIEPVFTHYLPLKKQVKAIEEIYGAKQNLILLDNNVLASNRFDTIINDILSLGFHKGAKLNGKMRIVDFNQGIDARLLTKKKTLLLAKTAIKPLRIAFDHVSMKKTYVEKVELASAAGISRLSNYVLYNYKDTPNDFYERLRLNVKLNEKLGTKIYSFPMKYIPLDATDRSFVGKNWNRQLLRGIQCILLATRGKVGPNDDFFRAAFGSSPSEFKKIAMMPEDYIIHRNKHKEEGAREWEELYSRLTSAERRTFLKIISAKRVEEEDLKLTSSRRIRKLLSHYLPQNNIASNEIIDSRKRSQKKTFTDLSLKNIPVT